MSIQNSRFNSKIIVFDIEHFEMYNKYVSRNVKITVAKILSGIFNLFEQTKCITVGKLDSVKVSFLKKKCPQALEKIKNHSVIMWKDRIEHLYKHSYDVSQLSVEQLINLIPSIISEPDYIGYRDKDFSLQFIKEFDNNILVAIRADSRGNFTFRTMYTITEGQLKDYIKKNRAWKYDESDIDK